MVFVMLAVYLPGMEQIKRASATLNWLRKAFRYL